MVNKACQAVEPHSSTPEERIATLNEAHCRGLKTYGMLCPLIPAFYQHQDRVDQAFKAILPSDPVEVFAEVINPRGRGLILTVQALKAAGLQAKAQAVDAIRSRKRWSAEARRVIEMVVDAARRLYDAEKLRVLVYPSGLTDQDEEALRRIPQGLIWLR